MVGEKDWWEKKRGAVNGCKVKLKKKKKKKSVYMLVGGLIQYFGHSLSMLDVANSKRFIF